MNAWQQLGLSEQAVFPPEPWPGALHAVAVTVCGGGGGQRRAQDRIYIC